MENGLDPEETWLAVGTWIDDHLLDGSVKEAGEAVGDYEAGTGSGWVATGKCLKAAAEITDLAVTLFEGGAGVKALSESTVKGIYEFATVRGKKYNGQSVNIFRRLREHIKSGKTTIALLRDSLKVTEVVGDKTAREIAEQRAIDMAGGLGPDLENVVNPIGIARRHLME